jgi:hypothetical protein
MAAIFLLRGLANIDVTGIIIADTELVLENKLLKTV